MWSVGTGSGVLKRIAAPMVGGIFTSFVLELLLYPAIYELWRRKTMSRDSRTWPHEETEEISDSKLGVLTAG
jgi:Cu(I)/Ag(I) efflux system membrane protein CusA/SilA